MQQVRRLLLVLLTGAILFPVHKSGLAAETGVIEGRVLKGPRAIPVGDVEVMLISAESDASDAIEKSTTTDKEGRYRFEDLPTGENRFYALDAVYQGGLFAGRPITLPSDTRRPPVIDTRLRVWPTTTNQNVLVMSRDDIFLSPSDRGDVGVVESVRVFNSSAGKAYIGRGGSDNARPGETPSVGFALPSAADNRSVAIVDADTDIPALLSTEYGFAITNAIPPGETRVTFSYPLEGVAGSFDLSRRALYPIVNMAVYAADPLEVRSNRLVFQAEVTVGGKTYDRYGGEKALDAGDSLQAVAAAEAGAPSGLLLGMAGVLALAVLLGLIPFIRMRRTGPRPRPTREHLIAEIARLDLEHEQRDVSTEKWAARRAELKAELAARKKTSAKEDGPR
jgi:hypothetical protein